MQPIPQDYRCLISERQRGAGRGKSVIETLTNDLQARFTGIGDFSVANF